VKLDSLDYVILVVEDIDRSVDFYKNILGLEVSHHAGEYVQMFTGTTRLGFYTREAMSHILNRKIVEPPENSFKFEIGFKVDNVDQVYEKLLDKGVKGAVSPTTRPWGQRTAYIYDPDRNLIELAQDHV